MNNFSIEDWNVGNIWVLKILGPWILRPKCGKESEHRWSHSISSIFVPSSLYISRESVKYVYSILKLLETKGHCDFWRECPPMVVARRNLETCGALVCSVCSVCAVCPLCNAATWICNSHIFCEGPASAVWPPQPQADAPHTAHCTQPSGWVNMSIDISLYFSNCW